MDVAVKKELTEVKVFAKGISIEEFKDGLWFQKLLIFAISNYRKVVTADYFKSKYRGLPSDAIADRRISLAKKYSAIEGGLSSSAYSAAVVATMGTKGGSSAITIPAAITSLIVDVCCISYLQLRLAYDLSIIYRADLDLEDPEDMKDFLIIAFGVKVGETFSLAIQKTAPETTRYFLKKYVKANWIYALKKVGVNISKTNFMKMSIPVASVGIAIGLNYLMTGHVGDRAKKVFRQKAAIKEAAQDPVLCNIDFADIILQVCWMVLRSDNKIEDAESLYLKELIDYIGDSEDQSLIIDKFSKRINCDDKTIFKDVELMTSQDKNIIYRMACIASIVDRQLSKKEEAMLKQLAAVCGCDYNKNDVKSMVNDFR